MNKVASAILVVLTAATLLFVLTSAAVFGVRVMILALGLTYLAGSFVYYSFLPRSVKQTVWDYSDFRNEVRSLYLRNFTLPTASTMALGGPIHLLCIGILASTPAGLREVAAFSALYYWYIALMFVPSASVNYSLPYFASAADVPAKLRTTALLFILMLSVGSTIMYLVIWVATPRILSLYGTAFANDASVLRILALAGAIAAVATGVGQILWAAGKTWTNFRVTLIYAICYLCASIYYIKMQHEGAEGLAKAIVIASTIQLCFQLLLVRRETKHG
jgi:O-antigen/teichoic acid export membrane protein